MKEYIRFMNRKNRKRAIAWLLFCAAAFFLLASVAYLNTRFNGFADVNPASFYLEKLKTAWERVIKILFSFDGRFINFFK